MIYFAREKQGFDFVVGTPITEEFNETLDSASVIVRANRRLNIKPYDEVCLEMGNLSFYFLLDTFVEEIESYADKTYIYTIELMSLTKYLEKIQLPNRMITHSLVSGQRTILSYINEYLELYNYKVKTKVGTTWQYFNVIQTNSTPEFTEKFNVPCRDLSFSKPTLRQALTTLMLQVGCLPIVKKYGGMNFIDFLDLRKPKSIFNVEDNSINFVKRSMASDSYVNNLVTMSDNVLDEENVVISETLGFRDPKNVFLKQQENLELNTSLPIYDVSKMTINLLGSGAWFVYSKVPYSPEITNVPEGLLVVADKSTVDIPNKKLTLCIRYIKPDTSTGAMFRNITALREKGTSKIVNWGGNPNTTAWQLKLIEKIEIPDMSFNTNMQDIYIDLPFEEYADGEQKYIITGEFYDSSLNIKTDMFLSYGFLTYTASFCLYGGLVIKKDATALCVEQSKRQMLDTDFLKMEDATTIEEFSKYLYGTVGYQIGKNTITGFSQTYNKAVAWWDPDHTYIENICNYLFPSKSIFQPDEAFYGINEFGGGLDLKYMSIIDFDGTFVNYGTLGGFSNLFFDIEYKPLNSLRLGFVKSNDVPLEISQFDSSENSITNLNDIAEVEQQKVNRLGNELYFIHQRTTNQDQIQPLNSVYEDAVVFKRTIAYNSHDYEIEYSASKDYVLQNYFTAIQTKYRAYEYVDYGKSVIRKENEKVYVLISDKYINGDDKIVFGSPLKASETPLNLKWVFMSGIADREDYNKYRYKYACQGYEDTSYKTDLSVVAAKNNLVFSFLEFDSVSYGPYIRNPQYDQALGGLPQQWYIKDPEYFKKHLSYLTNMDTFIDYMNASTMEGVNQELQNIYKMPLIPTNKQDLIKYNALCLVDKENNKVLKNYYLDQQERLNQTIQFEYYTDIPEEIKWTEKLQELCYFKTDAKVVKGVYVDDNFSVSEREYPQKEYEPINKYIKFVSNGFAIKRNLVKGSVLHIVQVVDNKFYDIACFKKPKNAFSIKTYYISLNDTKTFKVADYNEKGLLTFENYKVKVNTLNREIENV